MQFDDADSILNCWCRHLYCTVFGLGRQSSHKNEGAYKQGLYRCIICQVYWRSEDCLAFLCPCCNTRVRTKRRDKVKK